MWQSVSIVAISVLIGLAFNFFRQTRLPLFADWSAKGQLNSAHRGDNLTIAFEEAEALYCDQQAVFIDARPRQQFEMGHIAGARNLPWEDFDRIFTRVMSEVPREATIITYCEGESCSLSLELASALLERGYRHVRVLVDGWKLWQRYNLPIE